MPGAQVGLLFPWGQATRFIPLDKLSPIDVYVCITYLKALLFLDDSKMERDSPMSTAGLSEFPARVLVFGRLHLLRLSRSLSHRKLHSIPQGDGFFDLYPRFYSTS